MISALDEGSSHVFYTTDLVLTLVHSPTPDFLVIKTVTSELAHRMIDRAEKKAKEMGKAFVIAIVDQSGVIKAMSRMDGAPLLAVQIAIDKAYTSAGFGLATDAWYDFIKKDPPLAAGAPPGIDRLIVFGGGFPILVDRAIAGGIGVSGGLPSEDMEVAKAGLVAIGTGA